jgi:hypothetical protein
MEDFPWIVIGLMFVLLWELKTQFQLRDEMKLRHEREKDLQKCEQELFLLKEVIKKAGLTGNVASETDQVRDQFPGHADDFTL